MNVIIEDGDFAVFERDGRYYIRHDAGRHSVRLREDEISRDEALEAASSPTGTRKVLNALMQRLLDQNNGAWTEETAGGRVG